MELLVSPKPVETLPAPTLTSPPRLSATRATVLAFLATLSEAFDVPVFWPILVVYFCVLFALTMRRQIQYVLQFLNGPNWFGALTPASCCRHMIKYKYIPFDFGRKARYGAAKK